MSILDTKSLSKDYESAHTGMRTLWDSFDEYERIARNKPHPKVVAAKLPTVTDGTLSAVISSQPKRVVQRVPTGRIESPGDQDLAKVADYIWKEEIIPHANTNGDVIQKSWVMVQKALTYGMQYSYAFFKNDGDYYGGDFTIPYIKDLILQRGKVYGPDCSILYLRQWYTKEDIQQIIDNESKRSKNKEYQSNWNVVNLKRALKQLKTKQADATTPNERTKSPDNQFIEIIHAFEKGVGSTFYSFSIDLPDGDNVVKTRTNPDPSGNMPISFLYAEIDLSNPLGRGYVEQSGGMQNLVDSEIARYQLAQILGLNPPVMKWGDSVRNETIKWKSNTVWDMGSDVNSKIEVVNLNSHAVDNFVDNYSMMKSQILNLTGNQDSSVSTSQAGAASQSKTPQGVNQQQQKIGFDDNYIRKMFESWFQDNAERVCNIHFAEKQDDSDLLLTEEYLEQVTPQKELQQPAQPASGQPQDPGQPGQPGQPDQAPQPQPQVPFEMGTGVMIDPIKKMAKITYSEIKTKLKFKVDPTSSEMVDDQTQVESLTQLLQDVNGSQYAYYYLMKDGYQLNLGEVYKQLFDRLGIENIDKIVTKLPDNMKQSANNLSGMMNPLYDKPNIRIDYRDVLDVQSRTALLTNAGAPPADPNSLVPTPADVMSASGQANSPSAIPRTTTDLPGSGTGTQTSQVSSAAAPAPEQPLAPEQLSAASHLDPEDKALVKSLLLAGYSSQQALDGVVLLHHGKTHDEILQALGPTGGGQ